MRRLLWATGCAFFVMLLWSLFRVPDVPVAVIAALLAFVLFAAYQPAAAIVALVGLIPIASWTGRQWNGGIAWPEIVATSFLAGYALRKALERNVVAADALVYAIHSMIAVIAGSIAVELVFLHSTLGGQGVRDMLSQIVSRDYFIGDGGFESGDVAMRLVGGLLLAHAGATLASGSPTLGARLVRALVVGAVMAGVLNLWRLWLGAVRTDEPVQTFLRYLASIRFNAHYADVNAAGSYYVMALLPALALALTKARWTIAAVVVAVSLVLTGSRAAFIAGPVALAAVWFRTRQSAALPDAVLRRLQPRHAGALLALLVFVGMLYAGIARNVTPVARALEFRKEFTLTGLRMFASSPLFGVGVGDYREASADFSSPRLRAVYPNENAHNNFLQILAELGSVGFAVFAAVLIMASRRADRLLSLNVPAARGCVAGLLAFVLTCLAGHPLLVDESALTFWLLLGAAAGWGATATDDRPWMATAAVRWTAVALLLVVVVSIPARARTEFAGANLEHVGIGLSRWHAGPDGIGYRTAGATSTVFLPADAPVVTIRLRAVQPDRVLEVQLYLDGRPANAVSVTADAWTVVAVPIPPRGRDQRFRALEFRVANGSPSDSALLMIGKVEPR